MSYLLRNLARRLVLAFVALLLALPLGAFLVWRLVAERLGAWKAPPQRELGIMASLRPAEPTTRRAPSRVPGLPAASIRRVHVLDLPRPSRRWPSRLQLRAIEADGPNHRQLAQAIRDVALAGLDEDEVCRHLEAMGAEWISTRRRRRSPARPAAMEADPEVRPETATRVMRLSFPKPSTFLHALVLAPAIITVWFDNEGRAAGGSVRYARGL